MFTISLKQLLILYIESSVNIILLKLFKTVFLAIFIFGEYLNYVLNCVSFYDIFLGEIFVIIKRNTIKIVTHKYGSDELNKNIKTVGRRRVNEIKRKGKPDI